ncbi:MAG: penicillin-binding protein 2 [Phycisphaerales bacterium]|nr:penicillin-binding protein 2 [Phycisphaerae bacterium]NNF44922.1 penicillin-binding protein 2 [Phycisphaerales bacterium]NNM26256.1 penicillin-binding protein 2 [Phycisphaerales bacterium]
MGNPRHSSHSRRRRGRRLTPLTAEDLHRWQTRRVTAWGRVYLGIVFALLAVVLGRVVQLKTSPDPRLADAVGSSMSQRLALAPRGELLDRRGRPIAMTTIGHRLFVDPTLLEDPHTIGMDLAHLLGGDPAEIDRRVLPRMERRYVVVRELLADAQVDTVRAAGLRGVAVEPRLVRHYPYGALAAGIVGMVGFEHTGLSGFEHRFDGRLRPQAGRLRYLRDAERNSLWIDPDAYRPARPGAAVRLSLDLVIQQFVQATMDAAVEKYNAGGGRMVVFDCTTGEVLAMYDRLNPRAGWEEQTEDPGRERHPALGRNRCVTDPYEPGSTFKPFVWAAATSLGRATPEEVLPTPAETPYRTSYGRSIRDSFYHADSTWLEVMLRSLNSGMAIVAERLSHREMQESIKAYGFGERTGCSLPGESAGIMTTPRAWSDYTQSSVAMGHEIAVTPLQMVRAFSAFARDGTIPTPRLTAATGADREPGLIRQAISPEIALLTRTAMRDVMREGSGQRAQSSRYQLFGKSGTAQLPRREGGGYHERRYVSSFIAGAPYTQPRLVIVCVIDDPDRSRGHWGGAIAGPLVRDVMDHALGYLGVAEDGES